MEDRESFIPEIWSRHTREAMDAMWDIGLSDEPPHSPTNFLTRWYHNHRCTDCYIWGEKVTFVLESIKPIKYNPFRYET